MPNSAAKVVTPAAPNLMHPLDEFYAHAGHSLPPWQEIDGQAMPEPYRSLLVHDADMTPTLERFHKARIHLRLMGRRHKGDEYFREVSLLLDGSNEPVEFGAIKINLDRFPSEAREKILGEYTPLGTILGECKITHSSRPKGYLRFASDPLINEALNLNGAHILYGRRNTLFDSSDLPLAEIVEILPPAKGK